MSEEQSPSDPSLEHELDEDDLELMAALRAGDGSATTDEALAAHERALARALAAAPRAQDDEPEATPEELAAMGEVDHGFLEALRAADGPTAIASAAHERLLERALPAPRPRRRLAPVAWASSGLALAAAALLALRFGGTEAPTSAKSVSDPDTVRSRTTEGLVASAAAEGASTRVDRIAQARTGDYRKNRFRGWGAR